MADKKISALIVEDDVVVRETLREFLLHRDFHVTVAKDGIEGAALLERDASFEVVLTDLRLPEGDGLEVLRLAHEKNPWSYVVLITGFASLESAIEAVRLGAFDYLVKPFSLSELELTLTRIAEHRQLRRHNRRLSGRLKRSQPLRKLLARQEELRQSIEHLTLEVKDQGDLIKSLVEALQPQCVAIADSQERK